MTETEQRQWDTFQARVNAITDQSWLDAGAAPEEIRQSYATATDTASANAASVDESLREMLLQLKAELRELRFAVEQNTQLVLTHMAGLKTQ